jgi:phenylacetate-CoA ligase
MTLKVEADNASLELAQQLGDAVREVTKLRAAIEWAAPHSLPNDGKVIEDARSYR